MLTRFLEYADRYSMLPEGSRILAAVSGGADSMCLLELLLEASKKRGLAVEAAHFNHRLRGAEADRDEEFVSDWCRSRGVQFRSGSGDVTAYAGGHGIGIEEAARAMRYGFLEKAADDICASRIATAHNADDNAETMLLNLARGTGLRGLCGIPPVRGRIIRPLMCFTRGEIEGYLSERGIPHVEDSTNSEDICGRNRIRHAVMPVLRELNGDFSGAALRTAELLRRDEDYIASAARGFTDTLDEPDRADATCLAALPYPVASRIVRMMCGSGLSAEHVGAVLRLCEAEKPSAAVSLPGMIAEREYEDIVFRKPGGDPTSFKPVELGEGDTAEIPELHLRAICTGGLCEEKIHKSFTTFLFKKAVLCGKIIIRPRAPGDEISIHGRRGTKTLKKLFIEERVPANKRGLVPVLADGSGVLAVAGMGIDRRAYPLPGDEIIKIILEEKA